MGFLKSAMSLRPRIDSAWHAIAGSDGSQNRQVDHGQTWKDKGKHHIQCRRWGGPILHRF